MISNDLLPNYKQLELVMLDMPAMSSNELAKLMSWTQLRVNDALRKLRKKGLVYIAAYERQPDGVKGRCIPLYRLGCGVEAMPPKALSVSERNKNYRKRHSASISARRYTTVRNKLGVWSGLL